MSPTTPRNSSCLVRMVWDLLIVAILFGGALVAYKLTGHSLRTLAGTVKDITKAVLDSRSVTRYSKGKYTDIIFLHHSVGHNLIEQGGIREALTKAGFDFLDHDYNDPGLTGPDGQAKGYSYNVPRDNMDIDGLTEIFQQKVYPLPVNTLSSLLQHEVIILKSCYPNNNITSDEQLARDKAYYLEIRAVMDQHPEEVFILVTTPPLTPAETHPEAAARARVLANWLISDEFLQDHRNIYAFDLYSYLAEDQPNSIDLNMLKPEYQEGVDSHPNKLANEIIAPKFVVFIRKSINSYLAR